MDESQAGPMALDDAHDRGVADAQAFIDRHPHGYPAVVMGQAEDRDPQQPKTEIEEAFARGWFDRLGEEIGTEEDPTESWKAKMQAFDLWPAWLGEEDVP